MEGSLCVYPGSFDPVTCGHLDLIERAVQIFPQVIVAVLNNPSKPLFFAMKDRVQMLTKACSHLPTVSVDSFEGLLMDYMKTVGARIVLRGLRSVKDFESEFLMAQVNHQLSSDIETLFLMASHKYGYISSSIVKEVGGFGGDISTLIPACLFSEVTHTLKNFNK